MKDNDFNNIPQEKFQFVKRDASIHDLKLETKPIGYFHDAMRRFCRNKGSVVAALIILVLLIYAVVVPFFSKYDVNYKDQYYAYALPKSDLFASLGIWDGCSEMVMNQQSYDLMNAKEGAIVEVLDQWEDDSSGKTNMYYKCKVDSYKKVGYAYVNLTPVEYQALVDYQEKTGLQILYPMIDTSKIKVKANQNDPNYWFKHSTKGAADYDDEGNYQNIFKKDANSEDGYAYYTSKMNGAQYQVRVLYYNYYQYLNGFEPSFLFGADGYGQDIWVRLASGARLSFMLGIFVSVINFLIGTAYGAIEGYYGGVADMIMERISDILSNVPFIIVASLFQMYYAKQVGAVGSLIFAFILTGWLGIAYRVRTQVYRFKGQEYVLAARTLGAKDKRLIFRHILPNAIGTIVTSAALMIPSVIFTESTLSYLGIVDLQTSNVTSVGTLLSNGQSAMSTYPHAIFFPALFISLLMISFNIFGNGLRDAFNPSLRGAEE